jgi:predicted chitinase
LCGSCATTTTKSQITDLSITLDEFQKAFTSTGYPVPSYQKYQNFIKNAQPLGNIRSKRELAMFLAQIIWESGGLQYLEEIDCKINGCIDSYRTWDDYSGVRYYGRGYIQLSWSYNYKAASLALFNDLRLYTNPNLVAENEETSWAVSFWYWKANVQSKAGISEGNKNYL